MKTRASVGFILALFMVVLTAAASFADVSELIVVRASNDSLWKATCTGSTCTSFTSFPGFFGSQPTVLWDNKTAQYVLWGRASNDSIWRSTFSASGVFNNDWVNIAGLTSSPIGAAGGGRVDTFNSSNAQAAHTLTTATTNVMALSTTPPWADGWVQCTATGMVSIYRTDSIGDNVVYIGLTDVSAGAGDWVAIDVPHGSPAGLVTFPVSITHWFDVSSTASKTFYVTGAKTGASWDDVMTARQFNMHCEYYAYSY